MSEVKVDGTQSTFIGEQKMDGRLQKELLFQLFKMNLFL
jgi:hypothetical protein